jgi:hypothetical protein
MGPWASWRAAHIGGEAGQKEKTIHERRIGGSWTNPAI